MKTGTLSELCGWILILGGALMAYQGITNTDLLTTTLGTLAPVVTVVVFGGSALYMAAQMIGGKKKKK